MPPRWQGEGKKPFAVCPLCGHPLVSTMEFKYKEWICMGCLKVWEYLSARSAPWSERMQELYENHRDVYTLEREKRRLEGKLGQYIRQVGPTT